MGTTKEKMSIYTFGTKAPEESAEETQEEVEQVVTPEMVGAFIGTVFALPLVLMFAWNWSLPAIFGWKAINYFQAMCITIIIKLLK